MSQLSRLYFRRWREVWAATGEVTPDQVVTDALTYQEPGVANGHIRPSRHSTTHGALKGPPVLRGTLTITPRIRILAATLRAARQDAHFGLRELARRLDINP